MVPWERFCASWWRKIEGKGGIFGWSQGKKNFRGLLKDLREIRRRKISTSRKVKSSSHIVPETSSLAAAVVPSPVSGWTEQSMWSNLPPELFIDIVRRLDTSYTSWLARHDVVACAAVCRSRRYVTKEVVRTFEQCWWSAFPVLLKRARYRS